MSIIGKLIGGILGLIVFRNFIGAMIGAFVGHMFDLSVSQARMSARASSFIEPLFAFAGALAKSDGRVSELEIRAAEALMGRLRLDPDMRRRAIDRFNEGKSPEFGIEGAVAELRAWTQGRRDLAFLLLDLLLDLVHAEGTLAANKLELVRQLCRALGVSDAELAAVSAMKGYGPAWSGAQGGPQSGPRASRNTVSAVDPYVVLGITREAQAPDIKRAYRKLMSQHHPDKLVSKGLPQEMMELAHQKTMEIKAAYELIRNSRA